MAINEHITEFVGRSIEDWGPGDPIADPGRVIPRLSISWDEADEGERTKVTASSTALSP